ncbi:MAG: HEAT repeat domain-containing protein [Patescibacteria group bacterium]
MGILKKIDKNLIGYIIGVGILLFLFIFFITCTQIGHDVKKRCELAQSRYGGECVEALMSQVADSSSLYGKNSAIWALGQLGDKKALPFLERYDTREPLPDRGIRGEWNKGISQYELRKAIKLLKSGFNLSAFVWRD